MPRTPLATVAVALVLTTAARAQTPRQTQADDYTRYELLAPGSASFRIYYDVTATTPGAHYFFNSIREGSEATVHGVTDLASGRPLAWRVVPGEEARRTGHPDAVTGGHQYIRVTLAHPVPDGGEARIRIDKTYRDTASYRVEGDAIVFQRTLGIRRNAVVLPAGYELLAVNYPSQVAVEADGRIRVSFMNPGPAGVPYEVRAVPLPDDAAGRLASAGTAPSSDLLPAPPMADPAPDDAAVARLAYEPPQRAAESREIVYLLQQPETHAFRLYHDYTETRPGMDRYLNVVRAGSRATDPSATNLDTGAALDVATLRGRELVEAGILPADRVTPTTEVVVIRFDPVPEGGSTRLRIRETYTDPNRYLLAGEDLVWDRAFGRTMNEVVLPEGWFLTTSAIPAVVTRDDDGRVRLRFENPRPDEIRVFIKARRR